MRQCQCRERQTKRIPAAAPPSKAQLQVPTQKGFQDFAGSVWGRGRAGGEQTINNATTSSLGKGTDFVCNIFWITESVKALSRTVEAVKDNGEGIQVPV